MSNRSLNKVVEMEARLKRGERLAHGELDGLTDDEKRYLSLAVRLR